MKIGIDIYDTILSFYEEFAGFCNENYGTQLIAKDFGLDFYGALGSKDKALLVLKRFMEEGHGHALKFFEDFKNIFGKLNENFKVIFITSRSYDLRDKTIKFFKENLEGFDSEIHYSRDYDLKKKSFVCKNFKVDLLIDDHNFNAIDCAENGIKVLLLDKSGNQDCTEHENITRVKDWKEIMGVLNGY